jgi:putative nucleotidyltransferase with HDIG domain
MKNARILVVDDELHVGRCIGAMLESEGHTALVLPSVETALSLLSQDTGIDLVLTDLMIRESTGFTLLDHVRVNCSDIPVVMFTAVRDVSVALSAIRHGAYDYVLKPFAREQFLLTVRRALERRRLTKENEAQRKALVALVETRTMMLDDALHHLEHAYDVTLEALGNALDLRDAETEGHSKRVTAYTLALARAMGLSSGETRGIARGAFLHDIGKMAIPDHILLKPGKLDESEMAHMRTHSDLGYNMLRRIKYLDDAAEIVWTHHERFDGQGYPRGLAADDIPFGARLFAVADALDAMTSDRPYRRANTFEEARAEILRCGGSQFDPKVAELYSRMPDKLWQHLRREINQHNERQNAYGVGLPDVR